ncbi:MAG: hypothetical protein U0V70_18010 [Terriglobia bacterium]
MPVDTYGKCCEGSNSNVRWKMRPKSRIVITLIVLMGIILGWKGIQMRKDIPAQEIIRLERAIAVVNGENEFLQNNLEVLLSDPSGTLRRSKYDAEGRCLFDGLDLDVPYTIDIRRSDLKGMLLYRATRRKIVLTGVRDQYFVLVGASIGKAWEFQNVPRILKLDPAIVFGDRACYQFDKTREIKRLIQMRPMVSGVILKECASYFPRDIDASIISIESWVAMLRGAGIKPFLATAVPVTRENDRQNPGRMKSIEAYNAQIRDFAAREQIGVLDLERALEISQDGKYLNPAYAQQDGLHLVQKAYAERLNELVIPLIIGSKP